MGCFDSTCCLSGLPIKENDKIKIALITESDSSLKVIDYGNITGFKKHASN